MVYFWKIQGRPLAPQDFRDPELAERIMDVTHQLQGRVGPLKGCEHGTPAVLEVEFLGGDDYHVEVDGCCEAMVDQVFRRLA